MDCNDGFLNGFWLRVIEPNLATCLSRDLSNAAAHSARANNRNLVECKSHDVKL